MIFFQGHSSPGIYARAFLEGRITLEQLENFRRELRPNGGLSSYPHPWLMPQFWEFPTVSMGLGPMMAIYQARFNRYLEGRGLKPASDAKVWAFLAEMSLLPRETGSSARRRSRVEAIEYERMVENQLPTRRHALALRPRLRVYSVAAA